VAGTKRNIAVRLVRTSSRDPFERYFTVDWNTSHMVRDPADMFVEIKEPVGAVYAIWRTEPGPGWRTHADQHEPDFIVVNAAGGPLMIDSAHANEIRELSYTKEVTE